MTPSTLWHYTDVAGLCGILKSSTLRLGDARCLNDRTERSYGVALVEQALKATIAESDERGLLARVDRYMDHDLSRTDLYLCSFSSTSESLSQWQRYGADGYGYCLGFNFDQLLLQTQKAKRVTLRQMRYEVGDSVASVVKRIRELERAYLLRAPEGVAPLDAALDAIAAALSVELDELALELKNPIFRDELEWRLVYEVRRGLLGPNETIGIAIRGNYPKPYVDLKFPRPPIEGVTKTPISPGSEELERLPITEIICGPMLDQALAAYTVKAMINNTEYQGVRISPSSLHDSLR